MSLSRITFPDRECRLAAWFVKIVCKWQPFCLGSTCHFLMMTSSNGNIFCVTGHLCGEFTGLRWIPRTKASEADLSSGVFFDMCLNTRLRKQSWGWWFETLLHPLWRHCNVLPGLLRKHMWDQLNHSTHTWQRPLLLTCINLIGWYRWSLGMGKWFHPKL